MQSSLCPILMLCLFRTPNWEITQLTRAVAFWSFSTCELHKQWGLGRAGISGRSAVSYILGTIALAQHSVHNFEDIVSQTSEQCPILLPLLEVSTVKSTPFTVQLFVRGRLCSTISPIAKLHVMMAHHSLMSSTFTVCVFPLTSPQQQHLFFLFSLVFSRCCVNRIQGIQPLVLAPFTWHDESEIDLRCYIYQQFVPFYC